MADNKQPASAPVAAPPKQTTFKERLGYWFYFYGQSMSWQALNAFLATYLMMVGIDITKIATAMVFVKLWDSINDTIFGVIFDKVHFKSGNKNIPWLRMTVILIPLMTIFVYLIPDSLNPTAKLAWFIVGYLLWDASYTLSDIPLYNMSTAMTTNTEERSAMLSIARVWAMAGGLLVTLMGSFLVSERIGMSFTKTVGIIAFLVFLTMIPLGFRGKERIKIKPAEEKYTFRRMFKYLGHNKYLFLFYGAYVISGLTATGAALGLFVSYYLFGSALFTTLLSILTAIPIAIESLFINRILKHVDKFRFYFWCEVAAVSVGLLIYLAGYRNVYLYIGLVVLQALPLGFLMMLNLTFTPDLVEYGRYKTGIDARGIAFAFQSFAAKFVSLAQPIGLFILGFFGWISVNASSFAELQAKHITQSNMALNGLWITSQLIPVIGGAISLIPLLFYKLNDKDVQVMTRFNNGEITREEAEKNLSRKY